MRTIVVSSVPSAKRRPNAGTLPANLILLFVLLLVPHAPVLAAPEPPPIATDDTPLARQLQRWWSAGTAAGNVGDTYENRDRGHSMFSTRPYPQVSRFIHPTNTPGGRGDWASSWVVRPGILVGNSSTASSAGATGSNTRRLYSSTQGLQSLHRQYRGNNLHIYPEHQDHDPGPEGWGDLLPANTPYLLTSQGSSHSDIPFLNAVFATLAAFRPETKRVLATNGLLMPSIQMILRLCNTNISSRTNLYLSGLAHPSVFEGGALDPMAMATLAHAIPPDNVPPLAQLAVLSEDASRPGIDHFDGSERLGDTPGAIVRIWRGQRGTRRMTLSADASFDLHQRPLSFHWVVTRGDPSRLTVSPRNPTASVVDVTFTWPERRPTHPDSDIESNRIDLALLVSNGTWWSAPAFVTWLACDRELRTYNAAGQTLDIAYTADSLHIRPGLLTLLGDWLHGELGSPAVAVFRHLAAGPALDRFLAEEFDLRAAEEPVFTARERLANATNDLNQLLTSAPTTTALDATSPVQVPVPELSPATLRTLQNASNAVTRARSDLAAAEDAARLATRAVATGLADAIRARLNHPPLLAELDPALLRPLIDHTPAPNLARVDAAAQRLAEWGLRPGNTRWAFLPSGLRPGQAFTAAETNLVARFHSVFFTELLHPPGLTALAIPRATPQPLFAQIPWRDVYRHDPSGRLLGWRRFGDGPPRDFTADGFLVLDLDALGRPRTAAERHYQRKGGIVIEAPGARSYAYSYTGPDDLHGRPQLLSP